MPLHNCSTRPQRVFCLRFTMLWFVASLCVPAHQQANAAPLIETQLPGVLYIGRTDSTIPDPANASANGAAVSSTGSVSLDGALVAYTHLVTGGNVIVSN